MDSWCVPSSVGHVLDHAGVLLFWVSKPPHFCILMSLLIDVLLFFGFGYCNKLKWLQFFITYSTKRYNLISIPLSLG